MSRLFILVAALLSFIIAAAPAAAQTNSCVKKFWAEHEVLDRIEIGAQQASDVVLEVAKSLGIQRGLTVVTCREVGLKALTFVADGTAEGVPRGEYVIFNPDWVREVIGDNKTMAVVIFGHELGHVANRHFTSRSDLARTEMEREADITSGCAVARLKGDYDSAIDYLTRTRTDADQVYPNRETSLAAFREGFKDCDGILSCALPENSLDHWGFEKLVTSDSSWMTGGYDQPSFCNDVIRAQKQTYPNAIAFDVVTSSETPKDDCPPFNCILYQYHCTVAVHDDPVYKYVESPLCPLR